MNSYYYLIGIMHVVIDSSIARRLGANGELLALALAVGQAQGEAVGALGHAGGAHGHLVLAHLQGYRALVLDAPQRVGEQQRGRLRGRGRVGEGCTDNCCVTTRPYARRAAGATATTMRRLKASDRASKRRCSNGASGLFLPT